MRTQSDRKRTLQRTLEHESGGGTPHGPYFLEGADRVLRLLDAFTADTPELRLTDLSDRLGVPKSQALRLATTLEYGNYLNRDPQTKRYRLGMRLFSLGMQVEQTLDLKRVAQPAIQALADASLETVGLFVADRSGAICIDVRESPKGLRVFAQIGRRMPWHGGASGKIVLAYLPESDRERILDTCEFTRFTEHTITDPDRLRELAAEIKREGYHIAIGDLDEDAVGIGAPIFRHDGQIVGTISISAPIVRAPESERPRLIERVITSSTEVSAQLGYEGIV